MITKNEVTICSRLGSPISEYVINRWLRASDQDVLSVNVKGAFVSGGRGRQVIDESAERLRGKKGRGSLPSPTDRNANPGNLLSEAKERCDQAYAAYLRNPDSDQAWIAAGESAAFLEEVLERIAPAYANRKTDGDFSGDQASPNSLFERIGAEIERQIGPAFAAARGEKGSLGSLTMPLRLNATELAICAQMGTSPEEYLEAKKFGRARH